MHFPVGRSAVTSVLMLPCVAALALALTACGVLPARDRLVPVRVDHHVHVNSPAIRGFLPGYCKSVERYGGCDPAITAPLTPDDLLKAMDRAGVRRALVMSTGYLAESPMMVPQRADAAALLRAANDWTVNLARESGGRLGAFVAIDPLRPDALPEIMRWRGNPDVTGIKLHLTASAVSLRRDRDLAALRAVFHAAADARLAIVIHLRPASMDYGARDVQRFLADVLPAAGDTPVQIAHAGGWGGLDQATLSALGAFADAFARHPGKFRHVWFDLADVWRDDSSPANKQALVALIRRIGLRHFLPASDWPFSGDLADYYSRRYPELPLTAAEWKILRSQVAPYAKR